MVRRTEQPPAIPLRDLLSHRLQPGRLEWIGVRPARASVLQVQREAEVQTDRGIAGDRASARAGGKRQVSLFQAEHLSVIAQLLRRAEVDPALLRRNLVVRGINLAALRATSFRVGEVLFKGVGSCEPCSKLEQALGHGGYNACRGHGGILARVVRGGVIRVGDEVDFYEDRTAAPS